MDVSDDEDRRWLIRFTCRQKCPGQIKLGVVGMVEMKCGGQVWGTRHSDPPALNSPVPRLSVTNLEQGTNHMPWPNPC